ATNTATATFTPTKTNTPVPPTATNTATNTATTTFTPTKTNTPTTTPVPPTATFTATPSLPEFTLIISCTIDTGDPNNRTVGVFAVDRDNGFPTLFYTLYGVDPNTPLPAGSQPASTNNVFLKQF